MSDAYVVLFSRFIPCGVWEAVYLLDGLTKNRSDIQPDTLSEHFPSIYTTPVDSTASSMRMPTFRPA